MEQLSLDSLEIAAPYQKNDYLFFASIPWVEVKRMRNGLKFGIVIAVAAVALLVVLPNVIVTAPAPTAAAATSGAGRLTQADLDQMAQKYQQQQAALQGEDYYIAPSIGGVAAGTSAASDAGSDWPC